MSIGTEPSPIIEENTEQGTEESPTGSQETEEPEINAVITDGVSNKEEKQKNQEESPENKVLDENVRKYRKRLKEKFLFLENDIGDRNELTKKILLEILENIYQKTASENRIIRESEIMSMLLEYRKANKELSREMFMWLKNGVILAHKNSFEAHYLVS